MSVFVIAFFVNYKMQQAAVILLKQTFQSRIKIAKSLVSAKPQLAGIILCWMDETMTEDDMYVPVCKCILAHTEN